MVSGPVEEVYALAVRYRRITAERAARTLALGRDELEGALRTLTDLGLLIPCTDEPGVLLPVLPQTARARLLAPLVAEAGRCRTEYETIRSRLAGFAAIYDAAVGEADGDEQLRRLTSAEALGEELDRALRQCRTEVLIAHPCGARGPAALQVPWQQAGTLAGRGVRMRVLHRHTVGHTTRPAHCLKEAGQVGAEIRIAVHHVERVVVVDRHTAFLPARGAHRAAVVMREPTIVAHLAATFDGIWQSAIPYQPALQARAGLGDAAERVRRTIVRLLAEGHTDEAVAGRVGLSVRACREHIARLYEQYGARSRFQFGVLAAKAGLLEEECEGRAVATGTERRVRAL
jgi:DNA-binding CsgD family transcriptional regulator